MKLAAGHNKVSKKGANNNDQPGKSSPVLIRMSKPKASASIKNGKI
jgi:hypothetical protein